MQPHTGFFTHTRDVSLAGTTAETEKRMVSEQEVSHRAETRGFQTARSLSVCCGGTVSCVVYIVHAWTAFASNEEVAGRRC